MVSGNRSAGCWRRYYRHASRRGRQGQPTASPQRRSRAGPLPGPRRSRSPSWCCGNGGIGTNGAGQAGTSHRGKGVQSLGMAWERMPIPAKVAVSAQSRARVVAEEMPVQQRRQVSSTIAEPARPRLLHTSSSRGRAVAAQHERSHLPAATSVAASAGKPDMSPGSQLARLVLHTWSPGSRTRHGAPELAPLRPS